MDHWKAIQHRKDNRWELFNLADDISETKDVSAHHPDLLEKMKKLAADSHTPAVTGTYVTRERHERDRWAKWGTAKDRPAPKQKRTKYNRIKEKNLIPAKEMKLHSFSSENASNNRKAAFAIDGEPGSVWHSLFTGPVAKHPHELVIDLGDTHKVKGFRYLARQDGGWNGAFGETEFYVSDSPDKFAEQPAVKVTFKKERKAQSADCAKPVAGRYIKVRILSEVNGKEWASAAEIGVIGTK